MFRSTFGYWLLSVALSYQRLGSSMVCGLVIFHNGYMIVISPLLGYPARQCYNAMQEERRTNQCSNRNIMLHNPRLHCCYCAGILCTNQQHNLLYCHIWSYQDCTMNRYLTKCGFTNQLCTPRLHDLSGLYNHSRMKLLNRPSSAHSDACLQSLCNLHPVVG